MKRTVLVLAQVVIASSALAGGTITLSGTVTTTNVSGHTGTPKTVGNPSSVTPWGLKELALGEKHDKPCYLHVLARSLPDGDQTNAVLPDGTANLCGGNAYDALRVNFADNARYFIRGLQVCTTDKADTRDNRIKGVKIYPAKVDKETGAVSDLTSYEKVENPNCKKWHPAVYCPKGSVAVEVVGHQTDGIYRGLGMKCRAVTYTRTVEPPPR